MVNEINSNTAVLADSVPFPAGSPSRKAADAVKSTDGPGKNPKSGQASDQDAPSDSLTITQKREDSTAVLERLQQTALASRTSVYYARDAEDGKMYLHVKDKRTGEDLYRIPKDYLKIPEPEVEPAARVDVRI